MHVHISEMHYHPTALLSAPSQLATLSCYTLLCVLLSLALAHAGSSGEQAF